MLLLICTLIGSAINLPLFTITAEEPSAETRQQLRGLLFGRPLPFNGKTVIAVNLGGALITNLPADGCVEVACVSSRRGIQPIRFGPLPALFVFVGVGLGVLDHLFDLVRRQRGATGDGDLLLLPVPRSFADTATMPLASMSKVTSI